MAPGRANWPRACQPPTFVSANGHVEGHALDVTKSASIAALQGAIGRDHGRLDVLINNATGMSAFGEEAAIADLDAARKVMDVTLFGSWSLIEAMLPLVRENDHGRIVNLSSGAGSDGDPIFGLGTDISMGAGYGAAKAALNALTHRLAHEEAGRDGSTVRINAVCPGFRATFEGGEAMGARPPAESAKGVLWAARLLDDGPNGGLFRDGEPLRAPDEADLRFVESGVMGHDLVPDEVWEVVEPLLPGEPAKPKAARGCRTAMPCVGSCSRCALACHGRCCRARCSAARA